MNSVSKKLTSQLDKTEIKLLEKLVNKHIKLTEKMVTAQRAYTDAARLCDKHKPGCKEKTLQKLADKGFKLEYETMMAKNKINEYVNHLTKKYKK
jgi:hypothetical protein